MTPASIAALIYAPESDPSPAIEEAVRLLQQRSVTVAGALQHSAGPCAMELELLPCGRRLSISQDLGPGASGCRLDTAALAEAGALIRRSIQEGAALAVFNRFGAQEAGGKGLHEEIAAAVGAGIPVLIAVGERFLPQWSAFTGGDFVALPCTAAAVTGWWDALAAEGSENFG